MSQETNGATLEAPQLSSTAFEDAQVSDVQVSTNRELLVNPELCGDAPHWREIFRRGNEENPGCTESRILATGEVVDGEDSPVAFDGLYHAREVKVAYCKVPATQLRKFEVTWVATNPRREGEGAQSYDRRMTKAVRGWVRATLRVNHFNTRGAQRIIYEEV